VQIIIALVVTPEGLPLAYEVLPGNTADKTQTCGSSRGTVNLLGRVSQIWMAGRCLRGSRYPMPQISAQMWNLWLLEALCSAAVT
jgi:hypothetical protein